jgi:hypothetical protein
MVDGRALLRLRERMLRARRSEKEQRNAAQPRVEQCCEEWRAAKDEILERRVVEVAIVEM